MLSSTICSPIPANVARDGAALQLVDEKNEPDDEFRRSRIGGCPGKRDNKRSSAVHAHDARRGADLTLRELDL
jgi:hypothetical protein